MRYAQVAATGSALPERVVTNEELARMVDTSDEWIQARTGIRARRFADAGETASTLAAAAADRALRSARADPGSIDLLVVATISGDRPMPSTASAVQERLGVPGGAAFDLQAACAGFMYGLQLAGAQIAVGNAETALVIGTEVLSRFLDLTDRTTCVLFGDGAGAAVLVPGDEPGLAGGVLDNDPSGSGLLRIPAGGSARPASRETVEAGDHLIHMLDGREVFRRAVVGMADASARLLEKSGMGPEDVALLVPHQANARIIKAVAERMEFPMDRVYVDLAEVGNTSAASVPIALDRAWRSGRLRPGDLVLTVAFGAGLAWGANLIRWTAPIPENEEASA